tara:strand:- start:28 stop:480 length:453 start_codon:yes stop_codon:yes gene_type:complete
MNKKILIFCFFLFSCGYKPIYQNNDILNLKFADVILNGDKEINKKIINSLSIEKNEKINNENKLYLTSSHKIETTSKNSQGQVISFRTSINVNLKIENIKNDTSKSRNFNNELAYNNKTNKFELTEYQNSIKTELVNQIITEIIVYLNTQ